jgi:hypothetical protein
MDTLFFGRALYYPHIFPQSRQWLRTAALYHDGISRIVPRGFLTNAYDRHSGIELLRDFEELQAGVEGTGVEGTDEITPDLKHGGYSAYPFNSGSGLNGRSTAENQGESLGTPGRENQDKCCDMIATQCQGLSLAPLGMLSLTYRSILNAMCSSQNSEWINTRLRERAEARKQRLLQARIAGIVVVDASKFSVQVAELAMTLTHKVEREGYGAFGHSSIPVDTGMILRQLTQTYDLLRFVNGDETRLDNPSYRKSFSFVVLPLVRTMIDGFYNCTAMLDDPSRARQFRISGYYRIRESLEADEARYGYDDRWKEFLRESRLVYETGLRLEKIITADLDNKANRWPLLGEYLGRHPDTPHKQMLRKLTLGFWKEYSSLSHASYDGLVGLFPFIATARIPHESRSGVEDASERHLAMHLGRAAGLLLCLLTEVQHFWKFDGANIDKRLSEIWAAMNPIVEVQELYIYRYKALLRSPSATPTTKENQDR